MINKIISDTLVALCKCGGYVYKVEGDLSQLHLSEPHIKYIEKYKKEGFEIKEISDYEKEMLRPCRCGIENEDEERPTLEISTIWDKEQCKLNVCDGCNEIIYTEENIYIFVLNNERTVLGRYCDSCKKELENIIYG